MPLMMMKHLSWESDYSGFTKKKRWCIEEAKYSAITYCREYMFRPGGHCDDPLCILTQAVQVEQILLHFNYTGDN